MKRSSILGICALALAMSLPAQAGGFGGHGGHRGGYGGWDGHRHHHHHHHRSWVGPLVGAAIVGSVLYAASTPSYAAPVVVAPAPMPSAPPRTAYYCSAYGQYYPSVATCPVAWQLVSY